MANAGAVAVGKDASTAWHNPASMTRLSGTQIMGTAGFLIPNIKFDPDSDTPVPGGDGEQAGKRAPVSNSSLVHSLTDNLKFGFALGSLAGAGLGKTWAGRNMATKVQLLTMTGMPSLAYDSSPVDAKDRQASLPLTRQLRYAVGTQYQWSERLTIGGNFEYIDPGDGKIMIPSSRATSSKTRFTLSASMPTGNSDICLPLEKENHRLRDLLLRIP